MTTSEPGTLVVDQGGHQAFIRDGQIWFSPRGKNNRSQLFLLACIDGITVKVVEDRTFFDFKWIRREKLIKGDEEAFDSWEKAIREKYDSMQFPTGEQ